MNGCATLGEHLLCKQAPPHSSQASPAKKCQERPSDLKEQLPVKADYTKLDGPDGQT